MQQLFLLLSAAYGMHSNTFFTRHLLYLPRMLKVSCDQLYCCQMCCTVTRSAVLLQQRHTNLQWPSCQKTTATATTVNVSFICNQIFLVEDVACSCYSGCHLMTSQRLRGSWTFHLVLVIRSSWDWLSLDPLCCCSWLS